jgi:ABC-type transporter Mla MlaB component
VRTAELLDRPAGVERADHVCWAYADDASFEEAALRFLTDGLAAGDRLMWVGDGAADRLRGSAGPLAAVDRLTAGGALALVSVGDGYAASDGISPDEQFAFYDAATRAAIADGYRGLRVVAEITPLAADPRHLPDLLRWEHLADDFVASGSGFTALCAYRSDLLPAEAIADVASVHPVSHAEGSSAAFRIWFEDGALLLAGDVDRFTADRLARLLATTHVDGPVVTLDLSRLHFIDLAGVRVVARWAGELHGRSAQLALVGAPRLFRRMWDILAGETVPGVRFTAAGA